MNNRTIIIGTKKYKYIDVISDPVLSKGFLVYTSCGKPFGYTLKENDQFVMYFFLF